MSGDPSRTIARVDLTRSRIAERVPMAVAPGAVQEISVASLVSDDGSARSWRISLGRLERQDNQVAIVNSTGVANPGVPVFPSQQFAYTNGQAAAPITQPARRTNPVFGDPVNASACYLELAWGLGTAGPDRLLAEWPAQGGSVCVIASNVQVYACAVATAPLAAGIFPNFKATITPSDGLSTDSGGELSLTQNALVAAQAGAIGGAAFYVPDFARRVRVSAVAAAADGTLRVPLTGEHVVQCVFLDDRGLTVDSWLQGGTISDDDMWIPVPGRAVMLAVFKDPADNSAVIANVHWRIAP